MKALVTKGFDGRPDGGADVRTFKPGEEVHGELAKVAVAEGWATKVSQDDGGGDGEKPPAPPPAPATRKAPKKVSKSDDAGDDGGGE